MVAPATTPAITADSPTAPAPNTTRLLPSRTFMATRIDPAPVWMPQPSGPSTSSGREGSTFTTLRSVARQWVAKLDWPNQRALIWAPLPSVIDVLPSSRRPVRLRNRKVSQYAGSPARHGPQAPHESNDNTTWSPGCTRVTPSPTASTTPAPSCPVTIGGATIAPARGSTSVWHMPAPTTRTRTSP